MKMGTNSFGVHIVKPFFSEVSGTILVLFVVLEIVPKIVSK
jgi:hypothetical protein